MNEHRFSDLIGDDKNLVLETARLVLEPVVEVHAPLLWPLLQDESLYRFIPTEPPSLENLRQQYKKWAARTSPDGKQVWLNWVARRRESGDYIGQFQAGFDKESGFSIAYTLGTPFQKQGFATEGMSGVINFLRMQMKAQRIRAWVDTRNEASIRLMKRLGFAQVETKKNADRFKGAVSDEFVFEWKA